MGYRDIMECIGYQDVVARMKDAKTYFALPFPVMVDYPIQSLHFHDVDQTLVVDTYGWLNLHLEIV